MSFGEGGPGVRTSGSQRISVHKSVIFFFFFNENRVPTAALLWERLPGCLSSPDANVSCRRLFSCRHACDAWAKVRIIHFLLLLLTAPIFSRPRRILVRPFLSVRWNKTQTQIAGVALGFSSFKANP